MVLLVLMTFSQKFEARRIIKKTRKDKELDEYCHCRGRGGWELSRTFAAKARS
jgi:hypothetical protein